MENPYIGSLYSSSSPRLRHQVRPGLGRIVASHCRSSASYQIHLRESGPLFLKRQCDRTLGLAGRVRRGRGRRGGGGRRRQAGGLGGHHLRRGDLHVAGPAQLPDQNAGGPVTRLRPGAPPLPSSPPSSSPASCMLGRHTLVPFPVSAIGLALRNLAPK